MAKLLGPETADSSQTLTEVVHSDAGTVLGTVDYMSPEQVRAIGFGELRRIFLENRTHIGLDDLVKETEHVRSTGWLRRYPTLPDEYDRYDHSNLSTTMNVYVKSVDADSVAAMKKLEQVLAQLQTTKG